MTNCLYGLAFCVGYLIGGCVLIGIFYIIDKYKPEWIDKIFS